MTTIIPTSLQSPKLTTIIATVAAAYDIQPESIIGNRRFKSVATARQVVMYIARRLTNLSLERIGFELGGKDHTTVLYAVQKIQRLIESDGESKAWVGALDDRLRSQPIVAQVKESEDEDETTTESNVAHADGWLDADRNRLLDGRYAEAVPENLVLGDRRIGARDIRDLADQLFYRRRTLNRKDYPMTEIDRQINELATAARKAIVGMPIVSDMINLADAKIIVEDIFRATGLAGELRTIDEQAREIAELGAAKESLTHLIREVHDDMIERVRSCCGVRRAGEVFCESCGCATLKRYAGKLGTSLKPTNAEVKT